MRLFLLFPLLMLSILTNAQQDYKVFAFDLKTGTNDSIFFTEYDTLKTKDKTPFFIGNYNNNVCELDMDFPSANLWDSSTFTVKTTCC